ncbi:MAG: yecA family protein [Glaciecola sp.]|jgi:yecA family protein
MDAFTCAYKETNLEVPSISNVIFHFEYLFVRIATYRPKDEFVSNTSKDYESFSTMLSQESIIIDAAEVQGILCGMLAGGMTANDQSWIEALSDVVNQGDGFSGVAKSEIVSLFNEICQQYVDPEFALALCLPDDASPINERGTALLGWVNGFLLGFGLHQADLTGCSADVKEALEDFTEIARMDEEMSEDEESEQALFEVMEYVRITAMLCFNELGKSPLESESKTNSVH